jgi:hypothetical protein
MDKSFFGSFFSKKELLPSCHLPSFFPGSQANGAMQTVAA